MAERILGRLLRPERVIPPSMRWKTLKLSEYRRVYEESVRDLPGFWAREAKLLSWARWWDRTLNWRPPKATWFSGGKLDPYYNIIGRHEGTWVWDKTAIVYEAEEGWSAAVTYKELDYMVEAISCQLREHGVGPGGWVIIYSPPLIESVAAMLACIRVGAPFEPVFTGFGPGELAVRIRNRRPKAVVASDGYYRRGKLVDTASAVSEALNLAAHGPSVIVIERAGVRYSREWEPVRTRAGGGSCGRSTIVSSDHPLFGLHPAYEDGPQPLTHATGGYLVQAYSTTRWIGLRPHDTHYCTVWPGWITGVTYLVIGPLMVGSTVLLYDGSPDYPGWDRWWSLVERYAVTILLTTGGALRILSKRQPPNTPHHNMDTLKAILVTAEPLEPEVWEWAYKVIGTGSTPLVDSVPEALTGRIPVVNMYIQSELGTFITGNLVNYTFTPIAPGSVGPPIPGFYIDVAGDNGEPLRGGVGKLVLRAPWPAYPIEAPKPFYESWSRGYYDTRDYALMDKDGYIYVLGRSDRVMKISGYRLSPGAIEGVLESHPGVRRAIVAGRPDELRFEAPVALVEGEADPSELKKLVRNKLGPIYTPSEVVVVAKLPEGSRDELRAELKELLWTRRGEDLESEIIRWIRKRGQGSH